MSSFNKSKRTFRPKQKKIRFDLFKSNPMALRHCLLYEFLQGTPIKKVYSNICSEIGRNLITYQNFKILFNQLSQEKLNDEEEEKPIVEILRNDKCALRVCILYKTFKYRSEGFLSSVLTIFEKFCEVIGEDVMEYREFEFWFYRFLNGEYDVNHERDKDKKIYELMDMPIDVMENIVEYLDIFDRANLVQTSRSLQTFVEDQKLFHHTLELGISHFVTTVSLSDSVNIQYFWNSVGCKRIFKRSETHLRGIDHWKQALLDFKSILKKPKLHLDTLKIGLYVNDEDVLKELEDAWKFTPQLNVKRLILYEYSWDQLSRILPPLKPEYLTTIDVLSISNNLDSMNTIFGMEQWKRAKRFFMFGNCFIWPLHHLYHFKEFRVTLKQLSVEEIGQMKEILFNSPNFEKCLIVVNDVNGANAIEKEFGNYIQQEEIGSDFWNTCHYPIPNSTEYFEIKVWGLYIEIIRRER